jgi:hypothetical protein
MFDKILKKLGLVRISKIKEWEDFCTKNQDGTLQSSDFMFDCGCCNAFNFINDRIKNF